MTPPTKKNFENGICRVFCYRNRICVVSVRSFFFFFPKTYSKLTVPPKGVRDCFNPERVRDSQDAA